MDKPNQRTVDSVHQRLLNKARKMGRPFNELLQYYAMEKFLLRMSKLSNVNDYVLKGALLFRTTGISDIRSTRDIDLLKYGTSSIANIEQNIAECCKITVDGDGLYFDPDSVQGEEIRSQKAYEGIRVKVQGKLGNARITVQIDIGFGDVITPGPLWIEYPTMLDNNVPKIQAYTFESAVAEKYQAMVNLDLANSRMKDFYDIYLLIERQLIDESRLPKAIEQTFKRRNTSIPNTLPIALSEDFFHSESKAKQWTAFLQNIEDTDVPQNGKEVVQTIRSLLWPITEELSSKKGS